jgi:ATP-binding cassette subfamily B protein
VEVSQRAGSEVERVGRHGKTDYFGEIALLRDIPRTATVTTLSPVELYVLSRADFQELLRRSEEFHRTMEGAMDARYLNARTRLLLRR